MPRFRPLPAIAVATAILSVPVVGQSLPTNFVNETIVAGGLAAPHDFCFLPDGRVLIANRSGGVSLWAGGSGVTSVGTVSSVETGSERGLLSIEPDPNFPTNGYIYVWYSSTLDSFMHLDRFTCTGDLSNPSSTNLAFASTSRRAVLAAIPDIAGNHNGGSCRFGPDGMLYQTIGDDATSCNAQSTTSSVGCLLRMDVSALPAGGSATAPSFSTLDPGNNPLSANNDISQLVIAHGLRNPFRMEIDQVTGSCYIGDVGQNAVEEYSEYVYPTTGPLPLVNFGWPWREGNSSYSGCGGSQPGNLTAPIADVSQGLGWGSVMGGPRYRNQNGMFDFGSGYEGVAFFSDYFTGQLRALVQNGSTWSTLPPVSGQPGSWWATGLVALTALRQGPDGALYYTQHSGTYGTSGGTFERIRPLGPTNSVIAVSGGGQRVTIGETFPQPVVVQVLDTNNQPLSGGTVNFAVSGSATLTTTNPVIADSGGFAQTTVIASTGGGAITVTASTPGSQTNAVTSLFARRLNVIVAGALTVVSVTNQTSAPGGQVPLILMAGFPGVPSWNSPFGMVCTDPAHFLTVVFEDGSGVFGGVSLSGQGGTGTPGLTRVYNLQPGLLSGLQMKFTGIGIDPIDGLFALNCEVEQY
ncbi:MAG: PQQ-dependent sugar dehydrogenase [Planctomycetes bacterium]|nr:PQQ-dependent sugar dehydrogenase [Planctomycetota bacterium]